jgi:HEAT repeat protein
MLMNEERDDLQLALEADDRDRLERTIADGRDSDFDRLRMLVLSDETAPIIRRKALYALGRWPNKGQEATESIGSALPRLDETERMSAIDALGHIGTERALEIVATFVGDPAPDVRRQTVYALDQIGTPQAVAVLREIVAREPVGYVRDRAEQLLRRLPSSDRQPL